MQVHTAQLLNYLAISHCPLGLLFNLQGVSLDWRRMARPG